MPEIETIQAELLSVLNSLPGIFILLHPDAPRFTIAAVTDDYLSATFTKRKDIVGKGLFEIFTDNPRNEKATGKQNITNSLRQVVQYKKAHQLNNQRFDIFNPSKNSFEF